MANNKFRSGRERDPIAELARLIAEADPYRESAPVDDRFREEITPDGYDEPPALPPAPLLPADLNAPEQACEFDESRHDDEAYDGDDQPYAADEEYQTEVPRVRRRSLALVTAIAGLALVGTAGAFGYRVMFRGSVIATPPPIITASNEPNKIAPASSEPQVKNSGNARQDGTDTTGSIEKLVSREEQPATIEPPKWARRNSSPRVGVPAAPTPATAAQSIPNQVRPHVVAAADPAGPPPNAVASQRAGQSAAADGTAEPNSAHLAAVPLASAEANSTPAVTPPVLGSGYAVQVTSERSESGAQAAFRALQAKYPNQLRGRQSMIRRADLGAAGVYYRALVGPFASAEKAAKLCSGLKAAGGDCIIQKN
jgi:SPOR domain